MAPTTITVVAHDHGRGPPVKLQFHWYGEEAHLIVDTREALLGDFVLTKQDWLDLVRGSEALYRPPERGL